MTCDYREKGWVESTMAFFECTFLKSAFSPSFVKGTLHRVRKRKKSLW